MMDSQTKKLLALTLAVVVVAGGAFTHGLLIDTEGAGLSLDTDDATTAGNTQTNPVGVSVGNTESCTGNEDGCEATLQLVGGDIPHAAEAESISGV